MKLRNLFLLLILTVLEEVRYSVSKHVMEEMEHSLISLFGKKNKVKIDKNKIAIPQSILDLYKRQVNFPLDTTSILRKGLHTSSANTVRTFTHVGRYI